MAFDADSLTIPDPPTPHATINVQGDRIDLKFARVKKVGSKLPKFGMICVGAAIVVVLLAMLVSILEIACLGLLIFVIGIGCFLAAISAAIGEAEIALTPDRIIVREHDGMGQKTDTFNIEKVTTVRVGIRQDAHMVDHPGVLRIEDGGRTRFLMSQRPLAEIEWAVRVIQITYGLSGEVSVPTEPR